MKTTKINISGVLSADAQALSAQNTVNTVKTSMETIKRSVASDVLNRGSNKQKLDKIISQLDAASARIKTIRTTVSGAANAYYTADVNVQKSETPVAGAGQRLTGGSNDSAFRRG